MVMVCLVQMYEAFVLLKRNILYKHSINANVDRAAVQHRLHNTLLLILYTVS